MIMTQGYNLYRYNNNDLPHRKLSSHQFKLQIILGLLNHQVVTGPQAPPANIVQGHELRQWPIGSDTRDAVNNRRFTSDCRHCPRDNEDGTRNHARTTSYYCSACMVGLHPRCFHQFHEGRPASFRPRKRLTVRQFNPFAGPVHEVAL